MSSFDLSSYASRWGPRRAKCGLALLSLSILAASCATDAPKKTPFERQFERYRSVALPKAMAVAGDLTGVWAAGHAHRGTSAGLAIVDALERCDRSRHRFGITTECRIYAVGNQIVEGNPELEARYRREPKR